MTYDVSRRSLLALGAGLGATALMGGSALARAPKLTTQPSYFYRFNMGGAQVTVVSDGPLPLGPPKGTFVGIDVIDGNLTEINVTSPTGIRAIARLGGPDVAAKIWDAIEKKRAKG